MNKYNFNLLIFAVFAIIIFIGNAQEPICCYTLSSIASEIISNSVVCGK